MKSGNLNFLEPSGPLQACNGTALLLLFIIIMVLDWCGTLQEEIDFTTKHHLAEAIA